MYAIQWLRSLLFIGQMYLMMFVLALYYIPRTLLNNDYAFHGVHAYCNWVRWTASWMVGLKSEIRGEVPTDDGLKIGCVPVERGKRGAAIKKMVEDVQAGKALPGQLIILPAWRQERICLIRWAQRCCRKKRASLWCQRRPMWVFFGPVTEFTVSPGWLCWSFCQ